MKKLSASQKHMLTDSDGELVGQIFCTYCGNVNETEAKYCTSCGQYIADQGPDLSARLRRIHRYASHSSEFDATHESKGALMGVDAPPLKVVGLLHRIGLGRHTEAVLILLAGWFLFSLGLIAVFQDIEWPVVFGIFLLAALCCIISAVQSVRRL